MNDYTHLLLHEARTRLPVRPPGGIRAGRARRRTRWSRRLVRALTGGRSGAHGTGPDKLPATGRAV